MFITSGVHLEHFKAPRDAELYSWLLPRKITKYLILSNSPE
jgi:hypothetical protein